MASSTVALNAIVSMNSDQIGIVMDINADKYSVRVLTAMFEDHEYISLKSNQINPILQIKESDIHNYGLYSLTSFKKYHIIFKEPLLIPFAPRIQNKENKDLIEQLIQWWQLINQKENKEKLKVFMNLSHHETGPIVHCIDEYLKKHKAQLLNEFQNDESELNDIRKVLLIDGANTFDQGSYEVICRINHSCDPNCFVTTDGKVKALRSICKNEEIAWNFLNDRYLYSSIVSRQERMCSIWGFKCKCARCTSHFDDARIFKCVKCSKSSIFVSYQEEEKDSMNVHFYDCFECGYHLKDHEITYYLDMENKIDEIMSQTDLMSEKEFDETVAHWGLYLDDAHFKWFDLWSSMVYELEHGKKNLIFGKSFKHALCNLYYAIENIYNNSFNACRYEIEWKLLQCLVEDNQQNSKISMKDKILIKKLFKSTKCAQNIFTSMDNDAWSKTCLFVKAIH